MLPGEWVTLRDVYHCAIDKQLFANKIEQAQQFAAELSDPWATLALTDFSAHLDELTPFGFHPVTSDPSRVRAPATADVIAVLRTHNITHQLARTESAAAQEIRLRVEAVYRWYIHDWNTLDNKIRSSIVEEVSLFLSMFDLPAVARTFCPPMPEARPGAAGGPAHRRWGIQIRQRWPQGRHTAIGPPVGAPPPDAPVLRPPGSRPSDRGRQGHADPRRPRPRAG